MKTITGVYFVILFNFVLVFSTQAQPTQQSLHLLNAKEYNAQVANRGFALLKKAQIKGVYKAGQQQTEPTINPQYTAAMMNSEWQQIQESSATHSLYSLIEKSELPEGNWNKALKFSLNTRYNSNGKMLPATYEVSLVPMQTSYYLFATVTIHHPAEAKKSSMDENYVISRTYLIQTQK